jgi:uncharacterized protein
MPRRNVEIVQQIYDAMRRRDLPAIVQHFAPGIEMSQSTEVPWGGTYRGHAEVQKFFAKLGASVSGAATVERYVDSGDHVVAIGKAKGAVNASGRPYEIGIAHVWEIGKDGKIARVRFCVDHPPLLDALGAA